MNLICRPISSWPWPETPSDDRKRSLFRSPGYRIDNGPGQVGTYVKSKRIPFEQTLQLLARELEKLVAENVVLEIDLREDQIRIDGWPKATATPATPRVVLSFGSTHGPLRYGTDRYDHWQDNVRAVALSLEALRSVDRHGVTRRGEQYQGWKALPASTSATMDATGAAKLICIWGNCGETEKVLANPLLAKEVIREAAKLTHPDAGGTTEKFQVVQEAKRILEAHHGVKL